VRKDDNGGSGAGHVSMLAGRAKTAPAAQVLNRSGDFAA
jgi:hypothetical protein